ncbi:MAG: hypothetical protein KDC32_17075 [Saprospiraceae bacterium]|nr:hypothetical protein [Saprospiraceae bacterium]
MSTLRTTTRIPNGRDWEPLPQYGWRCGMYSLRPELDRHARNPEFIDGVRLGRAQRKASSMPAAYGMILRLPNMQAMRREIQAVFAEAAEAQRRVDAAYRAAARGMGHISSAGRDIGAVRTARADEQADDANLLWQKHRDLSDAYATERSRLLQKRGIKG